MRSVSFNPIVKVRYVDPEGSTNKVVKYNSNNFSYTNVQAEIFNRRKNAIENAKENMQIIRKNIKVYGEILRTMNRSDPDFEHFKELREDSWFKLKLLSYKIKHYQ